MQFTLVDGGVAAITVISGLLAYSRGLTREIFAIGGWVIAALVAFYLTPAVEPLVREIPGAGTFLAENCVIATIAAFTLIVALSLMVLSVFTPLFSAAILESPLAPIDRGLGFVFGVVRAAVLIAIAYLIYINLSGEVAWTSLDNAASRPVIADIARVIQDSVPDSAAAWFGERIDTLMANCAGEPGSTTGTDLPGNAAGGATGDQGQTGAGSTAPAGTENAVPAPQN